MDPDKARQMLICSDYPLDKIIYMSSGSMTIAPGGIPPVEYVPHNLPFRPLLVFSHSETSNFDISRTNGILFYGVLDQSGITVDTTDNVNIRIIGYNLSSSSKTIYWRCYGFMPSTVNLDAPYTASIADDFVVNTDYNYMKLFDNQYIPAAAPGSTVYGPHNLGYRPRALIWERSSAAESILFYGNATDDATSDKVLIEDNQLSFYKGTSPGGAIGYHYRIYIDD